MPCHAGWKLKQSRPIHFKLAEHLAQGKTPKECSRLTGLSYCQVSRLRGSPLIQEMIARARRSLFEADALAKQGLDAILAREEYKLLADLYAEHTKSWLISWRAHRVGLHSSHSQTSSRS
jgi:hypothetical protein